MTGAVPLLVIGSLPCEFLWYNFLASFPGLHTIQLLLLVCKNGEGRPGEILWHECLPWHTVGKHTLWKNAIYTCILHPEQRVVHFPLDKHSGIAHLDSHYKKSPGDHFDPFPSCVYLGRHLPCDKTFSSAFAYTENNQKLDSQNPDSNCMYRNTTRNMKNFYAIFMY